MAKRTERQRAIDRADEWFSKYIRLKYADHRGVVRCYTCSYRGKWNNRVMSCGHFQTRNKKSIRWHEDNARPQCTNCQKQAGQQYIFGRKLNEEREGLAEEMVILGNEIFKATTQEIREIAERYRKKVKQILR